MLHTVFVDGEFAGFIVPFDLHLLPLPIEFKSSERPPEVAGREIPFCELDAFLITGLVLEGSEERFPGLLHFNPVQRLVEVEIDLDRSIAFLIVRAGRAQKADRV